MVGYRLLTCVVSTDNLEWYSGYSVKYGLQYVNFTTQERAYKASFFYYVDVFNTYQEK